MSIWLGIRMTDKLWTPSGKNFFDELLDLLEETAGRSQFYYGTPEEIVYLDVLTHIELVSSIWRTRCEEKRFIT